MITAAAGKLYTPQLLALATELANYPLSGEWPLRAQARSKTCGSSITIGLAIDAHDAVSGLGMAVTACAVGQASAAIFARGASGRSATDIRHALRQVEAWLGAAEAPLPDWPEFSLLGAARDYPARHGALLLPWRAAAEALCKADSSG